jgi:four helix bundle protein
MSVRETGGPGDGGRKQIQGYRDLRAWQNAMSAAMKIFEASKRFPAEERYSLTDQIRRSSRSVAANIVEAWRKRRYKAAFVAKLSDAESEACETQTWIEFALRCGLLDAGQAQQLDAGYEQLLGQLVTMINQADRWVVTAQGGR